MSVQLLYRLVGLAVFGFGLVLAIDGPTRVGEVTHDIARHAGACILAAAVIVLIYNLAPRGTLLGPAVLAVAGLGVLTWQNQWWPVKPEWAALGITMLLLGGVVVIRKDRVVATSDPTRRLVALFTRRRVALGALDNAPEQLSLIAFLAPLEVDLTSAQRPSYGPVEVLVTCWGGAVRLTVPSHWAVVAGRLAAARAIQFSGALDSSDAFPSPEDDVAAEQLAELAKSRARLPDETGTVVVIHVLGLGGSVTVTRSN